MRSLQPEPWTFLEATFRTPPLDAAISVHGVYNWGQVPFVAVRDFARAAASGVGLSWTH
jgi:hypothetical protein